LPKPISIRDGQTNRKRARLGQNNKRILVCDSSFRVSEGGIGLVVLIKIFNNPTNNAQRGKGNELSKLLNAVNPPILLPQVHNANTRENVLP
jgi:hypothetical protein